MSGLSLAALFIGGKQTNQHDFLYWERQDRDTQQAIRLNHWKAIRTSGGAPLELYNLSNDPAEKTNLAQPNPEVVRQSKRI